MTRRHQIATFLLLSVGCTGRSALPEGQAAGAGREAPAVRALTDEQGYPLVGNVMAKGPRPRPRPDAGSPPPRQAEAEPGTAEEARRS